LTQIKIERINLNLVMKSMVLQLNQNIELWKVTILQFHIWDEVESLSLVLFLETFVPKSLYCITFPVSKPENFPKPKPTTKN